MKRPEKMHGAQNTGCMMAQPVLQHEVHLSTNRRLGTIASRPQDPAAGAVEGAICENPVESMPRNLDHKLRKRSGGDFFSHIDNVLPSDNVYVN